MAEQDAKSPNLQLQKTMRISLKMQRIEEWANIYSE